MLRNYIKQAAAAPSPQVIVQSKLRIVIPFKPSEAFKKNLSTKGQFKLKYKPMRYKSKKAPKFNGKAASSLKQNTLRNSRHKNKLSWNRLGTD